MEIRNKVMGFYRSMIVIPYRLEEIYNEDTNRANGGASCEFFPNQIQIKGRDCGNLKPFTSVKFVYTLNGKTRKRSRNWLRGMTHKDGLKLVNKLLNVGLISLNN